MDKNGKSPAVTAGNGAGLPEPARICARSLMTTHLYSVATSASVREVAQLLVYHNISALPVLDHGRIIGIVTEADLLHRDEFGNVPAKCDINSDDPDCRKAYATCAGELMTPAVVMASEDASLAEIADLMEAHQIKHVPIMRDGQLAGIVSRADIVRALILRTKGSHGPMTNEDDIIRARVVEALVATPGASAWLTDVMVDDGIVRLSGMVQDEDALAISQEMISRIPFVRKVEDHRAVTQSTWG